MKVWQSKEQKTRVAVVAGVRTPFAKAGTQLRDTSAVHLGLSVIEEVIARAELSRDQVDEVVFGNAGTPADAANISRVMGLRAGLPEATPAYTVHRNCASAMEAVAQGCLKLGAGLADVMIVGGTENMSQMPLLFSEPLKDVFSTLSFSKDNAEKLRKLMAIRPQWLKPTVALMQGLTDPVSGLNMGQTAEILARDFAITRKMQDEFAVKSHEKVVQAQKENKFEDEIMPIVLEPKYDRYLDKDIGPRENQTLEQLSKLKPFFDRENGTVTAGNACPVTDGACGLLLMSYDKAKSLGLDILGFVEAYTFTGCEPKRMGMGPYFATAQLLEATGISMRDVDLFELNEAFAAQVMANQMAFSSKKYAETKLGKTEAVGELPDEKLNVNGGAVALGHPVGATGSRLILTLLLEMRRRKAGQGIATLCIGGGQGASFLLRAQ